jgi:glutamine amidotransferase
MCQLLGMNCNTPTDICFSFSGFQNRGGVTDHHTDGWGIAFFEGNGCRVFLDHQPAATSPVAKLVREYPIRSLNVIAHIRKATCGEVALVNTHPFARELWGSYWIFAHNGTLYDYRSPPDTFYTPVGSTDSESAFCHLLHTLRLAFGNVRPPLDEIYGVLREWTQSVGTHGTFNYLLSDGQTLFAHCHDRLYYLIRSAPFSVAHLTDEDLSVDFREVTTLDDRVAVIATVPLTDNEVWTPLSAGEIAVFKNGQRLSLSG